MVTVTMTGRASAKWGARCSRYSTSNMTSRSSCSSSQEQQDSDDEGQGESEVEGEMWAPLDRPPPPLANEMQPLVTGELRGEMHGAYATHLAARLSAAAAKQIWSALVAHVTGFWPLSVTEELCGKMRDRAIMFSWCCCTAVSDCSS